MLERINLVPKQPISTKLRKATPLVVGAFLIMALLYIGINDRSLQGKIKRLDTEITRIEAQAQAAQMLQAQISAVEGQVKKLKDQHSQLDQTVAMLFAQQGRKKYYSQALAGIAEKLPSTVRCDKIIFTQSTGSIQGTALQYRELPEFIRSLNNDKRFAGAVLQDLDRKPEENQVGFHFTINFAVN